MLWVHITVIFMLILGEIFSYLIYEKERKERQSKIRENGEEKPEKYYLFQYFGTVIYERLVPWISLKEKENTYMALNILSKRQAKAEVFNKNKKLTATVLTIFFAGSLIGSGMEYYQKNLKIQEQIKLERQEYLNGANHYLIQIKNRKEQVAVEIPERHYTKKEIETYFKKTYRQIEKEIKGKNKSLEKVNHSLVLKEKVADSPVKIRYEIPEREEIDKDGKVKRDAIVKNSEICPVTVVMTLGKEEIQKTINIKFVPPQYSFEEQLAKKIKNRVYKEEKKTKTKQEFYIKRKIDGFTMMLSEEKPISSAMIAILFLIAGIFVIFKEKEDTSRRMKERNRQLLIDYPKFLQKFVLYLQSGLTARLAFERMAQTYQEEKKESKKIRYLYEEVTRTVNEIMTGESEVKAYYRLGKRLGVNEYVRFLTYVVQNLSKGSKEIIHVLEKEVESAFVNKREIAKKAGEEASTKLLAPMMILMLVILLIVMVPAFMNM